MNATDIEALLPCPFCGGKARLFKTQGRVGRASPSLWYRENAACTVKKCRAQSASFKRPGQAVAAWNTRNALADAAERGPSREELLRILAGLANAYVLICDDAGKPHYQSPVSWHAHAIAALARGIAT